MWSTDHIANYMNFTNAPEFELNPDYPMKRISLNTELTPVNNRGGLQQSYWTIKKMKLKTVGIQNCLRTKQIDNDGKILQKLW
jgi:hypothetical protein